MEILIFIDAEIAYDCSYTMKAFTLLVVRNALMSKQCFIMSYFPIHTQRSRNRDEWSTNIYLPDPSSEHYSTYFLEVKLQIFLQLLVNFLMWSWHFQHRVTVTITATEYIPLAPMFIIVGMSQVWLLKNLSAHFSQ